MKKNFQKVKSESVTKQPRKNNFKNKTSQPVLNPSINKEPLPINLKTEALDPVINHKITFSSVQKIGKKLSPEKTAPKEMLSGKAFVLQINKFLKKYNIRPNTYKYYFRALTHNSFSNENNLNYNYQRLELLGDTVLDLLVMQYLFLEFYDLEEGALSQMKMNLVRGTTLIAVTQMIGLNKLLRLGKGEKERIQHNTFSNTKVFADVFESLLGAMYLDLPLQVVSGFLKATLFKYAIENNLLDSEKDAKSKLQEIVAKSGHDNVYNLINYQVYNEQKIKNQQGETNTIFHVKVFIDNQEFAAASGYSKNEAEQKCAQLCLDKLASNL